MKILTISLMMTFMSFSAFAVKNGHSGEVANTAGASSEACCLTCPEAKISANCLAQRISSKGNLGQSRTSNPKKAKSVNAQ